MTVALAPEEKREFVHRLFTTIAPRYDGFNRLASLGLDQGWRRRTVRESALQPAMRVLDVCTGTGDLALLCGRHVNGRGLVVGVDFTQAMLDGAVRKARAAGSGVVWMRADALTLPFASERFDRVLIGFSTRNLGDLRAGLAEMVRVLKRRGKLVILETGWPSNRLVRAAYLVFLLTVARTIGWLLTRRAWPFTYLARSVQGFLAPAEIVKLLDACGTSARYVPLSLGLASLYIAEKR